MSSFEAIRGDVVFKAETGQAGREIEQLRSQILSAYADVDERTLRAATAQDKFDKAIGRAGTNAQRQRAAVLAYRREVDSINTSTGRASRGVRTLDRDVENLSKGALIGSGAVHSLSKAGALLSASFLGGAGVVYALRTVIKAGTEQTQILANLRNAVEASGNSWAGYKTQIEQATEATKRQSAFDDDQLYQSLQLLIRGTGDVGKALKLNSLAADVARGRNISLLQSAQLLVRVNAGQVGSLRRLGIEVDKGISGTKALEQVQRQYAGAAAAYTKTAAGAQESLAVAIGDTEKMIGRELLPTVTQYERRLANWLNDSRNQKRLQDDVNQALHTGGQIVHGLVNAEKALEPPIHAFVSALGGFENAVEIAFVAGIVAKAKRAAIAIEGLIPASAKARTAIVADATAEDAALAGVGGAATRAGTATAAGGAAGGLLAGAGGAAAGLLAKGGKLLLRGGEIYLVYKGASFALGQSPPTSQSGPNRYQGSNLGADYSNFFSDLIHHPGRLAENVGKGVLNDFGITNYGSSGISGGPGALSAQDALRLVPAIEKGIISPANIRALKDRLDPAMYSSLLALAQQFYQPKVKIPGTVAGTQTGSPRAPLTPAQQRQANLLLNPNDLGALRSQLGYDENALAFLQHQRASGKIGGKKYLDELQALTSDRDQIQGRIDQILQGEASKRAAASRKRAAAAKKAEDARGREATADAQVALAGAGPLGVDVNKLRAAHDAYLRSVGAEAKSVLGGVKLGVDIGDLQATRDQQLQNRLSVAQLHETQANGKADATRKAIKEEISAWHAILDQQQAEAQGLTGLAKAQKNADIIASKQALAQLQNQLKQKTDATDYARANEAQFLASASSIVHSYDPNFAAVPSLLKQTNSHLFNVAHETREQTKAVKDASDRARFAGTWSNLAWVDGAYA